MEPLGPVESRTAAFQQPSYEPNPLVRDTRFGIRNMPKSDEKPSIFSYMNPGRGQNGEHLS